MAQLLRSVSFIQLFSSSMTLQPHLHLLVPQGVFDGATFIELPPPSQEEVEGVLARMLAQARRTFESLEAAWPLDAFEVLQRQSAQERLDLGDVAQRQGKARLVAVGEGFSLHAGTKTHANDREALARLCRYGSRGPIAESRLTLLKDGRYEYQTKKGATLVLTAAQLTRRLISLIPPARLRLVNFYGAFSSHSKARSTLLPRAAPLEQATGSAPTSTSPRTKRPRIDWAALHARTCPRAGEGRMSSSNMRGQCRATRRTGSGTIRLKSISLADRSDRQRRFRRFRVSVWVLRVPEATG